MPRDVGSWTKNKLKILSDYLPVYLKATTRAMERIYIDGFAGPGLNRVRGTGKIVDGSPLIALDAKAENGTTFTRLFFIERDEASALELENTVAQRDTQRRCTVIPGDVNVELPRLIERLPKRSPTFVFLDPEGIDPQWTTLQKITGWKTELLINFPFGMAINRNPDSGKVNAYYGTREWRPLWESTSPGRIRRLLDLYKNRLQELGWRYTTDADPVVTGTRGQRLYYLIFVSKVEPGQRIMKWVQERPDSAGQLRFKF